MDNPEQGGPVVAAEAAAELPARTNKMTPEQAAKAKVDTFAHAVAEMARLKDQAADVATLVGKHRDEAKAKGDVVLASLLDVACKGLGATQRGLADILDEI